MFAYMCTEVLGLVHKQFQPLSALRHLVDVSHHDPFQLIHLILNLSHFVNPTIISAKVTLQRTNRQQVEIKI